MYKRQLYALAKALGRDKDAEELRARIELSEEGVNWLWNEEVGTFCSRDVISGNSSAMVTSASFLAFYADVGNDVQRKRLLENLERVSNAATYMVPSFDPEHEAFDSIRYWRGPSWAIVNFMVATGLREIGEEAWSEKVRLDNQKLMEKSGFYEAYCPIEGTGTGGDDFTWTAAMWLIWASPDAPGVGNI